MVITRSNASKQVNDLLSHAEIPTVAFIANGSLFFDRVERDDWINQARKLMD